MKVYEQSDLKRSLLCLFRWGIATTPRSRVPVLAIKVQLTLVQGRGALLGMLGPFAKHHSNFSNSLIHFSLPYPHRHPCWKICKKLVRYPALKISLAVTMNTGEMIRSQGLTEAPD